MKKITITLCCLFIVLAAFSEVFQCKIRTDKYGDIVSYEECRAIIKMTDSTIVVDEKGQELVTYKKYGVETKSGDRNNLVDVSGRSVYGYDTYGICLTPSGKVYAWNDRYLSKYEHIFEYKDHNFMFTEVDTKSCEPTEVQVIYKIKFDPALAEHIKNKNRNIKK